MLRLKNITKNYQVAGGEIEVLKGLNVCFRKNEFVSILGPSGCGKTTTLNIVGGLDKYTDGDLTLFRQTSFAYSQESLLNNPYAADVVWGYMAMKETVDPFVYFPYLLGWYSPKSTRLPVSMSVPSYDGSGADVHTLSYEFDDDGYVTRMSWQEGLSSYSVEFVYQ